MAYTEPRRSPPQKRPAAGSFNVVQPRELTMRIKQCKTVDELEELAEQQGCSMNAIHLSASLVQLRNLWRGRVKPAVAHVNAVLEQLCHLAMPLINSEFEARQLANALHAIGCLPLNPAVVPCVESLVAAAHLLLPRFKPQELANTAWALASLGLNHPTFLDALVAAAQPQLSSFNPEALANILWALAKLGYSHPAFMDAVVAAARPQISVFEPQNLANMVWALVTLGLSRPDFIDELVSAALLTLPSFTSNSLGNMVAALNKAGYNPSVMETLVEAQARLPPGNRPHPQAQHQQHYPAPAQQYHAAAPQPSYPAYAPPQPVYPAYPPQQAYPAYQAQPSYQAYPPQQPYPAAARSQASAGPNYSGGGAGPAAVRYRPVPSRRAS